MIKIKHVGEATKDHIAVAETIQKISLFDKQCLSNSHSESRINSNFLFCLQGRLFHLLLFYDKIIYYSPLPCIQITVLEMVITELRISLQK